MSEKLLEVKDLKTTFYNGKTKLEAIRGINLSVREGEILGIVGESGSGKSVLMKSILGIIPRTAKVDSGEIILNGRHIEHLSKKEKREIRGKEIAMIFQDPMTALNPLKKVGDHIIELLVRVRGMKKSDAKREAVEMLKMVGIPSPEARVNQYPHEFSGGQRQRIGIARALSINPEFILCDEAISALDVSIQAQVINMLEDLQKEMGLTYLFVAHDLSMVRHISDRIGVMYLGRIVEISGSKDLYKNPLHPYTKALLSAIPIPDPIKAQNASIESIKGELPSPLDIGQGCRFRSRCPFATAKCAEVDPEMKEVESGHFVACHLYE